MKHLILFLLLSSFAWAGNACVVTGTGNWNSAATWTSCGGTYPGTGDTVAWPFPGVFTVTIPDGFSTGNIGDGTAANVAVDINQTGAILVVNGTLNVQGNIRINAGSAELKVQSLTTAAAVNLKSTAGISPAITWGGNQDTTSKFTIVGTSSHWATITGIPAGNVPGSLNGTLGVTNNWQYAVFDTLGDASHVGLENLLNLTADHVLVKNSGQVHVVPGAGKDVVINHFDMRTPLGSFPFRWEDSGSATRTISNSTFAGLYNQSVWIQASDATFTNVLFYGLKPHAAFATDGERNTYANIGLIGDAFDGSNPAAQITGSAGLTFTNLMVAKDCSSGTCTGHIFAFAGDSGLNLESTWTDGVNDGLGSSVGLGFNSEGDYLITNGKIKVTRLLAVNGFGNIGDGFESNSVQKFYNNTVVAGSSTVATAQGIVLSEGGVGAGKNLDIKCNLFVTNGAGITMGTNSGYVRQSAMVVDYNASYNLLASNYLYNVGKNAVGYMSIPTSVLTTLTSQGGTTATSIVLPGTSLGIQAGDYVGASVFALITAVVEGGGNTTLTAGKNLTGGTGLTGAASGQSITVYTGYFASGYYGDGTQGAHDILNQNPNFIDATRSMLTWDTANGGIGTAANAAAEMLKINGWDVNGAAASFNSAYLQSSYLSYMRRGFAPRNGNLKGACFDGTDIGAIAVVSGISVVMNNWF